MGGDYASGEQSGGGMDLNGTLKRYTKDTIETGLFLKYNITCFQFYTIQSIVAY